ncbi:tyrosine-type recombinase/integrase, partial [Paramuribaculum intestinale]
YILKRYADMARHLNPELIPQRISPHCIRHSRAMHLLHKGAMHIVDLRDFLGHASIVTTGVYARADSKAKREALEKAYKGVTSKMSEREWENDKNLLTWLKQLGH